MAFFTFLAGFLKKRFMFYGKVYYDCRRKLTLAIIAKTVKQVNASEHALKYLLVSLHIYRYTYK